MKEISENYFRKCEKNWRLQSDLNLTQHQQFITYDSHRLFWVFVGAKSWKLGFFQESKTALHVACQRGHYEVAQLLLAHEADMEARDEEGNTPLHVATQNQQTELVHMLLDSGADPDSENQVIVYS